MSLVKRLKEMLDSEDIEQRYLATCILVDPSQFEEYALRYNLQVRKLKLIYESRIKV